MLKNILIALFAIFATLSSFAASLSVVSDLDDTIKITNSAYLPAAIRNALFNKTAFGGMPELLESMSSYTNDLIILSASPKIINKNVVEFLKFNDVNYQELHLRGLRDFANKFMYKYNIVKGVLEQSDDELVLIGDDVEIDQDVYSELHRNFPGRINTIYIHKITNKALLSGVVGYYTHVEVFANEYIEGRQTLSNVLKVISNFLALEKKELNRYFPQFSFCPTQLSDFAKMDSFALSIPMSAVKTKIIMFCKSRELGLNIN